MIRYNEDKHIPAWDDNDEDWNMREALESFAEEADAAASTHNPGEKFIVWDVELIRQTDGWRVSRSNLRSR